MHLLVGFAHKSLVIFDIRINLASMEHKISYQTTHRTILELSLPQRVSSIRRVPGKYNYYVLQSDIHKQQFWLFLLEVPKINFHLGCCITCSTITKVSSHISLSSSKPLSIEIGLGLLLASGVLTFLGIILLFQRPLFILANVPYNLQPTWPCS